MKEFLKLDYKGFNDLKIKHILSRFGDPQNLRVLYLSTYRSNYTRTETFLSLLKRNRIKHKAILTGESRIKYLKILYGLLKNQKDYDLIIVGFRGQEILPFIRMLSNKPVIFDAFVSIYDTLCNERKKISPLSLMGKLLKKYDSYLCRISNLCLVDTKEHQKYFEKEFSAKNVDYLYVDANTELFRPLKIKKDKDNTKKIIFWYGNVLPLQGFEVILNSAKILENRKDIVFRLAGPVKEKHRKLIKKLDLKNAAFIGYIPYTKLPEEINKADICLGGHFADIEKARRVIPGKAFQFLACEKTTILGDNLANREIFKESKLTRFVEMNNAKALADKILEILR